MLEVEQGVPVVELLVEDSPEGVDEAHLDARLVATEQVSQIAWVVAVLQLADHVEVVTDPPQAVDDHLSLAGDNFDSEVAGYLAIAF